MASSVDRVTDHTEDPGARPEPPEVTLSTATATRWGLLLWVVALAVLLALRFLGGPDQPAWWIWVPVTGIGIGLLGLVYLRQRSV